MNEIDKYFILALFVQALFAAVVLMVMFLRRVKALKDGRVPARYFKSFYLMDKEAPEDLVVISNHYRNLFEMPLLFIIFGVLCVATYQVDKVLLTLAWLYVFFRLVHTFVHLGRNNVVHRFTIFGFSAFTLLGMWIYYIGKIFS